MKRIKRIVTILILGTICINILACGNITETGETCETMRFSNLVDQKELSELTNLLEKSGVNSDNVKKVVDSVNTYNETIGSDLLICDGSIDLTSPIPQYDDLKIDEMWAKKNDMFVGYNCRLTAFELMKDFITVEDTSNSNPSALFMDQDALDNSDDKYITDDELTKFQTMYSTIITTSSTDTNEQYKVQKAYWDSIGIKFSNSESISLISVYIHNHFSEDENELIVGHTGVLIKDKDSYIFFEKLSFQLPYQIIRFGSRQEVKDYLMAAYDTDTTGECAKPFILENGDLFLGDTID